MTLEALNDGLVRWGPEVIGIVGLIGLIGFAATYARHAAWKSTPEGRSVMYLAVWLIVTIVLLVAHGFTGYYEWRWLVEAVLYSPLAWACWNLLATLRRSLGLPSPFLYIIARKQRPEKGNHLMTDTPTPTPEGPITTQQRHPWKATARTGLAVLGGIASAVPVIVLVLDEELASWSDLAGPAAQAVVVASIITRLMALPAIDRALETVGLGSSPAVAGRHARS